MTDAPSLTRHFESIAFQVEARRGEPVARTANRLVREVIGPGWKVRELYEEGGEFEALPRPGTRVSAGGAWDIAYRLRNTREIFYAEPCFSVAVPQRYRATMRRSLSDSERGHPPGTEDHEWSLKSIRVPEAWDLFGERTPGASVLIAHPDTGYTRHPEVLAGRRLRYELGRNWCDGEPEDDAQDPLSEGWFRQPGHGTGTSSVIMSSAGPDLPTASAFVTGVAIGAELAPFRVTKSVLLWSYGNLMRAIHWVLDQGGFDVISISLGGPWGGEHALQSAVQRALNQGVIVISAAGNTQFWYEWFYDAVVYPACYDEVIAVAASTIEETPWSATCRGPEVDVSAPGESVWRAEVSRDRGGRLNYQVERGKGSSFSVATTAGLAALWLSYHGKENLKRDYPGSALPSVFREVLMSSATRPEGWDSSEFGAGIVNAVELLPLRPPGAPARRMGARPLPASYLDTTRIAELARIIPRVSRPELERAVAALLHVDPNDLPAVMADVGDEFVFHVIVNPKLKRTLAETATASRRRSRVGLESFAARASKAARGTSRRLRARLAGP